MCEFSPFAAARCAAGVLVKRGVIDGLAGSL